MTHRGEMTTDHTTSKVREDGKYVCNESVQLVVGQRGHRGGDRLMVDRDRAVSVRYADKDWRSRLHQAILQRLATDVAGRTLEQTGDGGGTTDVQRVLKKCGVDVLRRAAFPACLVMLQDR